MSDLRQKLHSFVDFIFGASSKKRRKKKAKRKVSRKKTPGRKKAVKPQKTKKKVAKKAKTKTTRKKPLVKTKKAKKKVLKKVTSSKAKSAKKKTAKKKVAKKKPAKQNKITKKKVVKKDSNKLFVGEVVHFFSNVNVGVIRIKKEGLQVKEEIFFEGTTTKFKQKIKSMQINHIPIEDARVGEEVGLQVKKRVRVGDLVYKTKE